MPENDLAADGRCVMTANRPRIAADGGNSDDANAAVALRHLADAHAARLARGERKIAKLTRAFQRHFVDHVEERVVLERRQCELLLRLERDIPHGARTQWKWELSLSLQHIVGPRYSVAGVEERLTAARRAETDPGYWTQLAAACLAMGSRDFRRAHRKLKAKEEDEDDGGGEAGPTVQSPTPSQPAGEDGGSSDTANKPSQGHLPAEVVDILDADEGATDAELAAALAQALVKARAELATLMAENAKLKAEVERLSTPTPNTPEP